MTPPGCFLCLAEAAEQCEICNIIASCKIHLHLHRSKSGECFPFYLQENETKGRFLIASRDIEPLELILEDTPACTGPVHSTVPVCLECGHILTSFNEVCECSGCGSTLCSRECDKGPQHAKECEIFKSRQFSINPQRLNVSTEEYQFVMTLRLLLLDSASLDLVNRLEDHSNLLSENELSVYNRNVVNMIRDRLGNQQWSHQLILRFISIVRTNAFLGPGKLGRGEFKCLLPLVALMNHSCQPNTRIHHKENQAVVRATVPIKQGEEIFMSYTQTFESYISRRTNIISCWHFVCECVRCVDMTDMGTFANSFICQDCKGYMHPRIDENLVVWTCAECRKTISSEDITQKQEDIQYKLLNPGADIVEHLEMFLADNNRVLHTNNLDMVMAKMMLAREYGEVMARQEAVGNSWKLKQVKRKVELCEQSLKVISAIYPGVIDIKANLGLELGPCAFVLLQNQLRKGGNVEGMKEKVEELISITQMCLTSFQLLEEIGDTLKAERCSSLLRDLEGFKQQHFP